MPYVGRDIGLERARARKGHCCYGMGLGILILDDVYPGFPGDVRNASAYPFPIQFEIVEGVGNHQLCEVEDKSACWEPILRAARRLERLGCRAIAGECGFFAYFQRELAEALSIPVFMSSLLQVPWGIDTDSNSDSSASGDVGGAAALGAPLWGIHDDTEP